MLTSCVVVAYLLQQLLPGTNDAAGVLSDQTLRDDSFRLPSQSVFPESKPLRSVDTTFRRDKITLRYRHAVIITLDASNIHVVLRVDNKFIEKKNIYPITQCICSQPRACGLGARLTNYLTIYHQVVLR